MKQRTKRLTLALLGFIVVASFGMSTVSATTYQWHVTGYSIWNGIWKYGGVSEMQTRNYVCLWVQTSHGPPLNPAQARVQFWMTKYIGSETVDSVWFKTWFKYKCTHGDLDPEMQVWAWNYVYLRYDLIVDTQIDEQTWFKIVVPLSTQHTRKVGNYVESIVVMTLISDWTHFYDDCYWDEVWWTVKT